MGNSGLKSFAKEMKHDLRKNRTIYLLFLPVLAYFIIFSYVPMVGAQIAFRDFVPTKGMWGSAWVGLTHFKDFFNSYYFSRLIRNTLMISVQDIIFGFPAPILLALIVNEIRNRHVKSITQTITYLPHFVSLVVICGIIKDFLRGDGIINNLLVGMGLEKIAFLIEPSWFRPIFVGTNIWQQTGWGAIIYLAALTGIDQQLYEAASIDGAKKLRQLWHITLPGIRPTILIMFILRIGKIMTVGYEKVLLLYNENTYEVADVISTFVYRKGILEASYSYSTAVDLFNSIINFTLLVLFNKLCRRFFESSLW